ncbi:hypothetical protein [Glycomyces sp. NPDC047010]
MAKRIAAVIVGLAAAAVLTLAAAAPAAAGNTWPGAGQHGYATNQDSLCC